MALSLVKKHDPGSALLGLADRYWTFEVCHEFCGFVMGKAIVIVKGIGT